MRLKFLIVVTTQLCGYRQSCLKRRTPRDVPGCRYGIYKRQWAITAGRHRRTAPEVPEEIIVDMVEMLAEHGRLRRQDLDKLEEVLNRLRPKKEPSEMSEILKQRKWRIWDSILRRLKGRVAEIMREYPVELVEQPASTVVIKSKGDSVPGALVQTRISTNGDVIEITERTKREHGTYSPGPTDKVFIEIIDGEISYVHDDSLATLQEVIEIILGPIVDCYRTAS